MDRPGAGVLWTNIDAGPNTRFIGTGSTMAVVGDCDAAFFADPEPLRKPWYAIHSWLGYQDLLGFWSSLLL